MTVAVTVPYWRTPGTIRRCVDSILAQSHRDLVCVVVNDHDLTSRPWPALADVTDPRLVRFGLRGRNRGRYFVDAVCQRAFAGADWWMPVDADDWLDPGRLTALLAAAGRDPAAQVVMSGWTQHHQDGAVVRRPLRPPGAKIRAVAHLSNLWRPYVAAALAHPVMRVGWDQVMTMAVWTLAPVTTVDDWGYHRQLRAGSLTRDPATGKGSPFRKRQKGHQRRLWRAIRGGGLAAAAEVLAGDVPPEVAAAVNREAGRLRGVLDDRPVRQ